MSKSEPNAAEPTADHVPQTQPRPEAPDQTGAEQPTQTQGFWQQPTEPMEKAYRPLAPVSEEDGKQK